MTLDDFTHWLKHARPRQKTRYHVGCLMADRQVLANHALDRVATAAWKAAAAGRFVLYQHRLEPGMHEYWIERVA